MLVGLAMGIWPRVASLANPNGTRTVVDCGTAWSAPATSGYCASTHGPMGMFSLVVILLGLAVIVATMVMSRRAGAHRSGADTDSLT